MSKFVDPYPDATLPELHRRMVTRSRTFAMSRMMARGSDGFANELRDVCDTIIIRCVQMQREGKKESRGIFKTVAKVDPKTGKVVLNARGRPETEPVIQSLDEVKDGAWRCMETHGLLLT